MRCLLLVLLLLGACARLPAEEARETPAAAVAAFGFAVLSANGVPLGSAVAVAPGRLLTSGHILPDGTERLMATRGDGALTVEAVVLARSATLDLAVLAVPPGRFEPVPLASGPARGGERLWALGAPAMGPSLAIGAVERPALRLAGRGEGFTARIGALRGYSGGPALDARGSLRGLVTALLGADQGPDIATLTGLDLGALSPARANREVFILSIAAAMAESERIAPMP